MRAILVGLLAVVLTGCSTVDKLGDERRQDVRIESSAPARIEMNGQYVGDAPGDFYFIVDRKGRFDGYMLVKAYPVGAGSVEVKYFVDGSPAPRAMFFHMGLQAAPGVDVHIWK
jgi:hypothetical protein